MNLFRMLYFMVTEFNPCNIKMWIELILYSHSKFDWSYNGKSGVLLNMKWEFLDLSYFIKMIYLEFFLIKEP